MTKRNLFYKCYKKGSEQMKMPKVISKNNHKYIFVKEYSTHVLYQEMTAGYKESFLKQDLVTIKPTKLVKNIKPENDKNFQEEGK